MRRVKILLIGLIIWTGCSKKDDPVPLTSGQQISRTWILTALTSTDPDFQTSVQILVGSEWTFDSDKTFLMKASVSGMDISFPGNWSLSDDGKTLTVTTDYGGSPASADMTILILTATQLVLEENMGGTVNTYTFSVKP